MAKRIAVDTNILVALAVENIDDINCKKTDKIITHVHLRALQLISNCIKNKSDLFIPTIVISEFFRVQKKKREIYLNNAGLLGLPFDYKSAEIAADIETKIKGAYEKFGDRNVVRFDTMIVATCLSHSIDEVYTNDFGFIKLAENQGLTTRSLIEIDLENEHAQTKIT